MVWMTSGCGAGEWWWEALGGHKGKWAPPHLSSQERPLPEVAALLQLLQHLPAGILDQRCALLDDVELVAGCAPGHHLLATAELHL